MEITSVRVRLVKNDDSKLKAVASVTFDDSFAVHDVKVLEGTEGPFIAMPSKKLPDGTYRDVAHPTCSEMRETLKKAVLQAYSAELEKTE